MADMKIKGLKADEEGKIHACYECEDEWVEKELRDQVAAKYSLSGLPQETIPVSDLENAEVVHRLPTEKDYDFERRRRADEEEMRLMVVEDDFIVESQSGSTYMLETEGEEAKRCTCPDWETRQPEGGCKHMIAWAEWTFEEVAFDTTGEVLEV